MKIRIFLLLVVVFVVFPVSDGCAEINVKVEVEKALRMAAKEITEKHGFSEEVSYNILYLFHEAEKTEEQFYVAGTSGDKWFSEYSMKHSFVLRRLANVTVMFNFLQIQFAQLVIDLEEEQEGDKDGWVSPTLSKRLIGLGNGIFKVTQESVKLTLESFDLALFKMEYGCGRKTGDLICLNSLEEAVDKITKSVDLLLITMEPLLSGGGDFAVVEHFRF